MRSSARMPGLSRGDVEHVAHLARLGLTADELGRLEGQLNHILDQYTKLAELDTDGDPADGPDDRAREHPARGRRHAVAAGRGGARATRRQRPAATSSRRRSSSERRVTADRRRRMTDLTRLLAHEMTDRLRAGEIILARADRGPPRRRRGRQPRPERLADDRSRVRARPGRRRRRPPGRPRRRSAARALHPLLGVPVALKDLVSVKGGQCTAGSRILEGYIAPFDAHITERLRAAGAVILGKTNMDEFAMGSSNEHSAYGPVANPWDLETRARRHQRRIGGRGGRVPRPALDRDRHGRLDPPAGGADAGSSG